MRPNVLGHYAPTCVDESAGLRLHIADLHIRVLYLDYLATNKVEEDHTGTSLPQTRLPSHAIDNAKRRPLVRREILESLPDWQRIIGYVVLVEDCKRALDVFE